MPNHELIPESIITSLVKQRNRLLELFTSIANMQKEALDIASNVDYSLSREAATYTDDFRTIFSSVKDAIGDKSKTITSEAYIGDYSIEKINDRIRCSIDAHFWKFLFNRSGLFAKMTLDQRLHMQREIDKDPKAFELETILSTFQYYISHQDQMVMEALVDIFTKLSATYTSNQGKQFNKKIILKSVVTKHYDESLSLTSPSDLKTLVECIWKAALCYRWEYNDQILSASELWVELNNYVKLHADDADELKDIEIYGIQFKLHKNGNAHVVLPDSLLYQINATLAKCSYLPN